MYIYVHIHICVYTQKNLGRIQRHGLQGFPRRNGTGKWDLKEWKISLSGFTFYFYNFLISLNFSLYT